MAGPGAGVAGAAGTHLGPIWVASWNTLAQYPDGSYIWYNDALDGNSVQIRVRSVDVYGLAATTLRAVQELDEKLEELRRKKEWKLSKAGRH